MSFLNFPFRVKIMVTIFFRPRLVFSLIFFYFPFRVQITVTGFFFYFGRPYGIFG